jgi:hypothetical protein
MITEYHGKLNLEINHDCKLQTSPELQNHYNNCLCFFSEFSLSRFKGLFGCNGVRLNHHGLTGRENKLPHPVKQRRVKQEYKRRRVVVKQEYKRSIKAYKCLTNIIYKSLRQWQTNLYKKNQTRSPCQLGFQSNKINRN